jgi:hypothetical protein
MWRILRDCAVFPFAEEGANPMCGCKEKQVTKRGEVVGDKPSCGGDCNLVQYKFEDPDSTEWFDNMSVDAHWVKGPEVPADQKATYDKAKKRFKDGFSVSNCNAGPDCKCEPDTLQPGSSVPFTPDAPPWGKEQPIEISLEVEVPGMPDYSYLSFYRCTGKMRRLHGFCASTKLFLGPL